jgi:RHS repeat-associated protein
VRDEWGRTNLAQQFNLTVAGPAGTVLLTNAPAGSTAPLAVARSLAGSPFLFHGQYFDADTGLYYLRARFYDPFTGLFLQRDPAGYADGVNHYAGFANNPVNLRDPTGAATEELGRQLEEAGNQANMKQDGLSGYLAGRAMVAVGTVLQLGTKAAEGWNLLNSDAPGTVGLLNRMRGAALVTEEIETVKSGYESLQKVAAFGAAAWSRAQGMMSALRHRSNPTWDKLRSEGMADFEIEGYVNAMKRFKKEMKARSVEVAIRGFGEKAQARRENVTKGTLQKPTGVKAKTGADATIEAEIRGRAMDGTVSSMNKTFVSDTDLFYIKVNGRTISAAEASRFQVIVGQEQARAFQRRGYSGIPNVGVLHGPHVNMPELIGTGRLKPGAGAVAEADLIRDKVGGPGDAAFAIRLDGAGNVTAFNPDKARLRSIVMHSLKKFRASPVARQHGLTDLGPHWFRGFDEDLPEVSLPDFLP